VYLADLAQFGMSNNTHSSDALHVDLGAISHDAARWWAAILASGTGWEAAITCSGKRYLSPWSIRIATRQSFSYGGLKQHRKNENWQISRPPKKVRHPPLWLYNNCRTFALTMKYSANA